MNEKADGSPIHVGIAENKRANVKMHRINKTFRETKLY